MNIAVYCGASSGNESVYREAAVEIGEWLSHGGHTLVYGGGKAGLMGILADTVLAAGSPVIGVIPTFLQERELAHPQLDRLITVGSMAERKAEMLQRSEVCLALPGGPGTLEEIIEAVSWARIGQNPNPCIFYNKNDYYQPIKAFFQQMVHTGFLTQQDHDTVLFSDSLSEIETFIQSYQPPFIREYR